jgi:Flp pilus assembly protein TadD
MMGAARALAIAISLVLFVGNGACAKSPKPAPDPAARAQAMIDAGNQAYRAGDYRLAARRYSAAAVDQPNDPVPFYGLGMSLAKLGRDEDARAAYSRARELTRKQQP